MNCDWLKSRMTYEVIIYLIILLLSLGVFFHAWNLDVPDAFITAPGLMPIITVILLLGLVFANLLKIFLNESTPQKEELSINENIGLDYKSLALVIIYICLVGQINYELNIPIPYRFYTLTSFEFISFIFISLIMKRASDKSFIYCFLVSFITVLTLAIIFKYGFGMIMPFSY